MRFNEAVKRNHDRFPDDFMFILTNQEVAILKSQIAISSLPDGSHGGRRKPPRVFTEHGAIMASAR
jgi:ORF6N domain